MKKILISIILLIGTTSFLDHVNALSCKNEDGLPEDWFIMYKMPRKKSKTGPIKEGGAYSYISSSTVEDHPGWFFSDYDLDDKKSMTYQTLAEVYQNPKKFSYVQYNDDKPDKFGHSNSIGFAHAKGALVWNNEEALWLIHSAPKFTPDFGDKVYKYPKNAKIFGQNFMCISLNSKESVNKILNHLVQMEAQVYTAKLGPLDNKFKSSIQTNFEILESWLKTSKSGSQAEVQRENSKNLLDKKRSNELINTIKSKEGNKFVLFSKNKEDLIDLYYGLASPYFNTKDMSVKFWSLLQKKQALLGSTCSKNSRVKNIEEIEFKFVNKPDIVNWSFNDHSKWSICNDEKTPCYCAGDMNRATTQIRRGGGLVCILNEKVRNSFRSIYKTEESCQEKTENNPFFK